MNNNITLSWKKNLRDENYKHIIIWNDSLININDPDEIKEFSSFIMKITNTNNIIRIIGNVQQENSNTIDLLYLIHNEDIQKFTMVIHNFEMIWYEECNHIYSDEFVAAYPKIKNIK